MELLVDNIESIGVLEPYDFSEDEFLEEIRKGEEGPFYTIKDAETILERWKEMRRKK